MKNKTAGIAVTIAGLIFCCAPGLILSCMGLAGIVAPPQTQINDSTYLIMIAQVCGGLLLMFLAIVVGFFALRGRSTPKPVYPVSSPPSHQTMDSPAVVSSASPAINMDSSSQQVYDRIMTLNRSTAPYQIIDGRAKGVDLIAEWKIVDAQWYEIFAKANLSKVFRIYMKFDPQKREVRAMDEELNVSWRAGVPSFSAEASFFRGQKTSISFGTGYAFTENFAPGQVYKYKFNTNEIKKPIQEAIAASGWTYKGVAFGKL